jgi:hypothetical protein
MIRQSCGVRRNSMVTSSDRLARSLMVLGLALYYEAKICDGRVTQKGQS